MLVEIVSMIEEEDFTVFRLFSVAGVVIFRRSFFLRTNVFVSNVLSLVDAGVEGSISKENIN